jgi:hypothetical protein
MVKWKRRVRSGDLIDRRGSPGRAGGIPIRVGTLGRLGGPGLIVIAIIVIVNVLGGTGLDGGVGNVAAGCCMNEQVGQLAVVGFDDPVPV